MTRTWLDDWRDALARATPRPWKLWGMEVRWDKSGDSNLEGSVLVATTHRVEDGKLRVFDARAIALTLNHADDAERIVRAALEVARNDALVACDPPCEGCYHALCPDAEMAHALRDAGLLEPR